MVYPSYGSVAPPYPSRSTAVCNEYTGSFHSLAKEFETALICAPESIQAFNLFPPISASTSFHGPIK